MSGKIRKSSVDPVIREAVSVELISPNSKSNIPPVERAVQCTLIFHLKLIKRLTVKFIKKTFTAIWILEFAKNAIIKRLPTVMLNIENEYNGIRELRSGKSREYFVFRRANKRAKPMGIIE
jgi:hypothetical protein